MEKKKITIEVGRSYNFQTIKISIEGIDPKDFEKTKEFINEQADLEHKKMKEKYPKEKSTFEKTTKPYNDKYVNNSFSNNNKDIKLKNPNEPASEAQKNLLKRLGAADVENLTKQQASDMIQKLKDSQKTNKSKFNDLNF